MSCRGFSFHLKPLLLLAVEDFLDGRGERERVRGDGDGIVLVVMEESGTKRRE